MSFHDVLNNYNLDLLQERIKNSNCDINQRLNNSGDALLHFAVINQNIEMIKILLKNSADVNVKDLNWNTPLHYATIYHNILIIKLLFHYGANVNAQNANGWTSLHFACSYNSYYIIDILLEYNADINLKNKDGETGIDVLQKYYNNPKFIQLIKFLLIRKELWNLWDL